MPGCDGAKLKRTLQEALPARVAAQLVVSVKSPVSARVSAKAVAPVFWMVRVWVALETLVTTTALGKLIEVVETERLGLTLAPLIEGWGSERPVTRTDKPWSSASVVASDAGVWVAW